MSEARWEILWSSSRLGQYILCGILGGLDSYLRLINNVRTWECYLYNQLRLFQPTLIACVGSHSWEI